MKELSIEEKAKRYDEVRKKIAIRFGSNVADEFFAEFEESEDEKNREGIKQLIQCMHDADPRKERWLSWLEKQESKPNWCHHEVDLSDCSEEYRKAYYDGWNNCNMQYSQCKSESNDVVKCLINGMKFYYEDNEEATWGTEKFSMKVKDILTWLEDQGQHYKFRNGIQIGDKVTRNEDGVLVNLSQLKRVAKPNEKQGEQKPTDKVEPKFKIGDFIVNDYCMGRIVEITNDAYLLDTEQGIPFSCHSTRLWDVTKDAKDGDVLACNEEILLFKSYSVQGRISLYCWYNGQTNNFNSKEVTDASLTTRNKICPATKEQRDLLFQKMHKAGYEWDAELKQLKKIEHSSKEWNERDSQISKAIIKKLGSSDALCVDLQEAISWVSSVKDRVQPQPKQEWSEEDKKKIDRIYLLIGEAADEHAFSTTCRLIGDKECVELQDWLKSIIHQNSYESK